MADDYTGLLTGSYWSGIEKTGAPTIVTYSFPTTGAPPAYISGLDDPALTSTAIASYQGFDTAEQALARSALAEWGDNCGLIFIEVAPGQGDINLQKLDFSGTGYDGAGGIAYRPFGPWDGSSFPDFTDDLDAAGDVFMNSDIAVSYGTLLHEIGHAIGLKHPTEAWTQFANFPPVVHNVWAADDPALTIMSQLAGGAGHLTAIDLQAAQWIYGSQAEDGTQVAAWSFNVASQTLSQTGTTLNDRIRGSSVKDVIRGDTGNDVLFGLSGDDTLLGGSGNDSLYGGSGGNRLAGGDGDDRYFVTPGDSIVESVTGGFDSVYALTTYRLGNTVEALVLFGSGVMTGTGNALANSLYSGAGGGTLSGLGSEDYLQGQNGADRLIGGAGTDSMAGGLGADRFIFTRFTDFGPALAADAILDFSRADRDKIDLHLLDPDAVTAGDQAFSFIGTTGFSNTGQFQVRYQMQGADALVQIDSSRDQVADYTILLYATPLLTAANFLL